MIATPTQPAHRRSVSSHLQKIFLQNIRTGAWTPNHPIPAENDLARVHGACRSTVRRAIRELEVAGLLSASRGKGRIVVPKTHSRGRMIGLISSGRDIGERGAGFHISQGLLQKVGSEGDHFATFAFSDSTDSPIGERMRTYGDLSGVGLLGPAFPTGDIPALLSRCPVVALARDECASGVPSFFIDYGYHACRAAAHLLAKGHRQILVTHGRKNYFDRVGANIDQGVEWAYSLAGVDPSQILSINATLSRESGREIHHALQVRGAEPTAVISYGTWVVSGLLAEAKASANARLAHAEMIILNDLEDESLAGRVSFFRCPYETLANDAATTLYSLIHGERSPRLSNPYRGEMVLAANQNEGRPSLLP